MTISSNNQPKNFLMEFEGMELSLRQKKALHDKLMLILKTKLKETPNDQFLIESKIAEEQEWAKIEHKFKNLKEQTTFTVRKM